MYSFIIFIPGSDVVFNVFQFCWTSCFPVVLQRSDFHLHEKLSALCRQLALWVCYRVVRKVLKYPFIIQRLPKDTERILENREHLVPCVFLCSRPFSKVRGALWKCRFQQLHRRYLKGVHSDTLSSAVALKCSAPLCVCVLSGHLCSYYTPAFST